MKIYIVTAGSYSDYHIEKVFTDKEKAENYRKWCYDANDLEEYETEDDFQFKGFYQVMVEYKINDNGRNDPPKVSVTMCTNEHITINNTNVTDYHRYGGKCLRIWMLRHIPEENWNEEFYRKKYTKAVYDIAAIVQQKLIEGFTIEQINELLNTTYRED